MSLRPESLSPTLNREWPNLSNRRYKKRLSSTAVVVDGRVTYLELPFLVAGPGLCHTCDNARFATSLIPLDELLYRDIVHVHALDRVPEVCWVIDFEKFVLAAPVAVSTPLAEEEVAAVLRFHVVHLLDQAVRHAPCFEDWVGETRLACIRNRLMINHILNR